MHGAFGEDGRIQGMLDFLGIPYTGSGVLGSAIGMDKVLTKDILVRLGYKVTPYFWFFSDDFKNVSKEILSRIEGKLKYPLFVKPACAGSSIGVTKAESKQTLTSAIKKIINLDQKILVEEEIKDAVDINCAVLGGLKPLVSVCEQPLSEDGFLSFSEKYLKGGKKQGMAGLARIVPAPIPEKASKKIQEIAKDFFKEIGGWGMARMDFLYQRKTGKIYPNEINTIPGSLAYYLWQASGINPSDLIDRMIDLSLERNKIESSQDFVHQSRILDQK